MAFYAELFRPTSLTWLKTVTAVRLLYVTHLKGKLTGIKLQAIPQFADKKQRITDNTLSMFSHDINDFTLVGKDSHVENVLLIIVRMYFEGHESELKKIVDIICERMQPEIGIYANEVIGTFGQILQRGMDDAAQSRLLRFVFDRIKRSESLRAVNHHTEVLESGRQSTRKRRKRAIRKPKLISHCISFLSSVKNSLRRAELLPFSFYV